MELNARCQQHSLKWLEGNDGLFREVVEVSILRCAAGWECLKRALLFGFIFIQIYFVSLILLTCFKWSWFFMKKFFMKSILHCFSFKKLLVNLFLHPEENDFLAFWSQTHRFHFLSIIWRCRRNSEYHWIKFCRSQGILASVEKLDSSTQSSPQTLELV